MKMNFWQGLRYGWRFEPPEFYENLIDTVLDQLNPWVFNSALAHWKDKEDGLTGAVSEVFYKAGLDEYADHPNKMVKDFVKAYSVQQIRRKLKEMIGEMPINLESMSSKARKIIDEFTGAAGVPCFDRSIGFGRSGPAPVITPTPVRTPTRPQRPQVPVRRPGIRPWKPTIRPGVHPRPKAKATELAKGPAAGISGF
jgi:hypothetical protein